MSRIGSLCAVLAFVTFTCFGAGDVRYLSAAGDDAADGTAPERAWRTLEKMNSDLPAGATCYLRRGDAFFGAVEVRGGLDAAHPTRIAAFGDGPCPEISFYAVARAQTDVWERVSSVLWRIDFAKPSNFVRAPRGIGANVGFMRLDGFIAGQRKRDAAGLAADLDFCCDSRFLVVRCGVCPSALWDDIRFACNGRLFAPKSNTEARDILFRGCGGHGVQFSGENVRLAGCAFRELGGAYLVWGGPDGTRYGNGVECWAGTRRVVVERCTFADIYDVAFTMQGSNPPFSWEDVRMSDCTVERCTQAFEVWTAGCKAGVGMKRCLIERNRIANCGWSWGVGGRPSAPLLINCMETDTCDIRVTGNTILGSRAETIHCSGGISELPRGYVVRDNVIELKDGATVANLGMGGRRYWGELKEKELRSNNTIRKEGAMHER